MLDLATIYNLQIKIETVKILTKAIDIEPENEIILLERCLQNWYLTQMVVGILENLKLKASDWYPVAGMLSAYYLLPTY